MMRKITELLQESMLLIWKTKFEKIPAKFDKSDQNLAGLSGST
jgi:hypothetical protein